MVGCHGRAPLLGAMVRCHGGVPLLGAMVRCHGRVHGGCHWVGYCWVPW